MLTLCIDTAYKYLTCALIQDDKVLSSYSELCFKRQSEEVFHALELVFESAKIDRQAIDSICISSGPGSYTGVRIAMTIAKVIGQILPCDVYTISTLRLYAGNRSDCMVLMDARAGRAYIAIYDKEKSVLSDTILPVAEIEAGDHQLIGDASLLGREDDFGDIAQDFLAVKPYWKKIDEIAYLTPEYLKESESYYR